MTTEIHRVAVVRRDGATDTFEAVDYDEAKLFFDTTVNGGFTAYALWVFVTTDNKGAGWQIVNSYGEPGYTP